MKDPAQAPRVEREVDGRGRVFVLDRHGLRNGLSAEFIDQRVEEFGVIKLGKDELWPAAAGKLQDVIDERGDAFHLLADALLGDLAQFRGGVASANQLRAQADERER